MKRKERDFYMNRYWKYEQPRQAIFKLPNNNYRILTQYGESLEVTKDEILVYLFSNNQANIIDIQKSISINYNDLELDLAFVNKTLGKYVNNGFLNYSTPEKEFHPIYSFNPEKIVKKLDQQYSKEKIITVGKLEFAVTDACPFHCSYCSRRIAAEDQYISYEEKEKLVYYCFEMGAYTLNITGGEPLFDKAAEETIQLITYAKKLGYKRIYVSTSGYGIIENIDRLASAGLDEIQISYNKCELFEEDRVRNKFIENNIKDIRKVIPDDIRFGACCVLTKENLSKIEDIIEFCIDNKLWSVYFYPVMPVGGAIGIWDNIEIETQELARVVKKIQFYKDKYKEQIFISAPQAFLNPSNNINQICEGGTYMLYATNRGNVSACACSPSAKENFRNMKIEEIWMNSQYFEKYRHNKTFNDVCQSCDQMKYCLNCCVIRNEQANNLNIKYKWDKCQLKASVSTPGIF